MKLKILKKDKVANSFLTVEELLDEPRKDCPTTLPDVPSFKETPLIINDEKELRGTIKN